MASDGKARPNETAAAPGAGPRAREAHDPKPNPTNAARPAAGGESMSAASDEVLAKQALEELKRMRAKVRLDKMAIPKAAPVPMRPAVIVARPPAPRPPWVVPFAALTVSVGLLVTACTGATVYLTMQPSKAGGTTSAEIRNLRETVAQLRRQVAGVSENLDGLRTAVDLSSKTTTDRFGRFAENLDRVERTSSSYSAKIEKLAMAQVPAPAPDPAASKPQVPARSMAAMTSTGSDSEFTGTLPRSERASAPRNAVKGWSVKQAYEGVCDSAGAWRCHRSRPWTTGAGPWSYRGDQDRQWTSGCVVQRRGDPACTQGVALISAVVPPAPARCAAPGLLRAMFKARAEQVNFRFRDGCAKQPAVEFG